MFVGCVVIRVLVVDFFWIELVPILGNEFVLCLTDFGWAGGGTGRGTGEGAWPGGLGGGESSSRRASSCCSGILLRRPYLELMLLLTLLEIEPSESES